MPIGGRHPLPAAESRWRLTGDWALVLTLLILGVVRYFILRQTGAVATIDAGNWLAFSNSLLGEGARSEDIVYPPLVPLLTRAAVSVFGLVDGVALMGALSSLVPGIGVYWALRSTGLSAAPSFGPAVLVAGATSTSEAAAWGGFPQLLTLGLLVVVLLLLDRFILEGGVKSALILGTFLALLVGASHFTLSVAAVSAVILLLLNAPLLGSAWRRLLAHAPLIVGPSLVFLPIYRKLAVSAFGVSSEYRELNQISWDTFVPSVEFLYRDLPWLWRPILVLAVVAPVALAHRRDALWRLTSSISGGAVLLIVVLGEPRYLYMLPVAGGLALGLLTRTLLKSGRHVSEESLRHNRQPAFYVVWSLVALSLIQVVTGLVFFREQQRFYAVVTPGVQEAISYVARQDRALDLIALPSLNDAPLGWWVEAQLERPVVYGSPLRWLTFADELERAELANRIFAPGFPSTERYALARSEGVNTLFIPKRWGFFDSNRMPSTPDPAVIFENDEVVILDVERALRGASERPAATAQSLSPDWDSGRRAA